MKNPSVLSFVLRGVIVLGALLPAAAHAHPGHDGHELTWDFGHLASYPGATLMWTLAFAAGIWGLSKLANSATDAMRASLARRRAGR
jgi:hypothetical protein